jgi:hypothetical protein
LRKNLKLANQCLGENIFLRSQHRSLVDETVFTADIVGTWFTKRIFWFVGSEVHAQEVLGAGWPDWENFRLLDDCFLWLDLIKTGVSQLWVTRLGRFAYWGLFSLARLNKKQEYHNYGGIYFFTVKVMYWFWKIMGWVLFWSILSQTHQVTLFLIHANLFDKPMQGA